MARGGRHSVVFWFFMIVLVAVIAFGVTLYVSGSSILDKAGKAAEATQQLETALNDLDLKAASNSAREASGLWDEVNTESHAFQWQLASYLPVLGEDVRCMQQASDIADSLTNDAMMPVVEQAEKVLEDSGKSDLAEVITDKVTAVGDLASRVQDAHVIVSDCRTKLDSVPKSHSTKLNDTVTVLKEEVANVDETLSALDGLLSIASTFSELAA